MTSNGPAQPDHRPPAAAGPALPGAPAPGRTGVDLGRLRLADCAVAAGTLLYLLFMILPWFRIDAFDLGFGYRLPGVSVNGFDSRILTVAVVLLLMAAAWALLPAAADVRVPFPRELLTAGLAALAFLLTLTEWLSTFDAGFTLIGLLAFVSSAAVLACAALGLLPALDLGSLPGGLVRAAQWADRPGPQLGRAARPRGEPTGPPPIPGPAGRESGQMAAEPVVRSRRA